MPLVTEILFYRGNLADMPLLPLGMPAFAVDAGVLYVGNGIINVPIGSGSTTVVNTDGSLTISPNTGNIVASLNVAHSNAFTKAQSIHADVGNPALTLKGESGGSANILEVKNDAGDVLFTIDAAGKLVLVNSAVPTEHCTIDFRADPAAGGSAFYLEPNSDGLRRLYLGSPGQKWYSLDLAHLAAGVEGLQLLNLNPAGGGGHAVEIGSIGIINRNDPAVGFGPMGYFTKMTFHAGSSTALMTLDSGGGSFALGVVFFPIQAPTVSAPAYVLGGMYFDTTLNKLRIGGATGWETVTSV